MLIYWHCEGASIWYTFFGKVIRVVWGSMSGVIGDEVSGHRGVC